jgi:hypothetical protein
MTQANGIRVLLLLAVTVVGLLLVPTPAHSQLAGFEFTPPATTRAVGGRYTVQWRDRVNEFATEPPAITWYYSKNAAGEDRKRMRSVLFHDDFSGGFRANWNPQGQFFLDWEVRKDRDANRQYLVAPRFAGPAFSRDPFPRDVVFSALVRSPGIQPEFTLGLRAQANGKAYQVEHGQGVVRITQAGRPIPRAEHRLPAMGLHEWYWYEVGLKTQRRSKDVVIRFRILDARRQKVLVAMDPIRDRAFDKLQDGGTLMLMGPAHYAEIYVDPWSARWADDPENEFTWSTESVPDGDYFLVAEISDGKKPPRLEVSAFQVQVRNADPANAGN